MYGCRTSCVPHLRAALEASLPQQVVMPVPPMVTSAREAAQGPAPWGRRACLAHQLVPRDCAEEGVRLQLCYATSSRAQASFGIVLQELQRKAMGQEDGEMGTLEMVPRLDPAFPQPLVPFSLPSTRAPHLSEQ